MIKIRRLALIPIALGVCASGWSITFSGSSGNLAASAEFIKSGSNLTLILTNTSLFDVLVPADILTGVYFDYDGAPLSLTKVSAVLTSGSIVQFGSAPGGVVGGEWAYRGGMTQSEFLSNGANYYRSYGVSSSGLGLFGPSNRFPGANLQGPTDPDGLQYGITSAGDNFGTGNTPVTGTNALIKNSVTFTFSGLSGNFDENKIKDIQFQYGTSLREPHYGPPSTPGPMAAIPFGIGLLAALRRRRIRA